LHRISDFHQGDAAAASVWHQRWLDL
jgi:hypothetical protein